MGSTYIEHACILRLEPHNRLAAQLDFGAVLRSEPRHDFDAVRHDRGCGRVVVSAKSCVQRSEEKGRMCRGVWGLRCCVLDFLYSRRLLTLRVWRASDSRAWDPTARNLRDAMRSRYRGKLVSEVHCEFHNSQMTNLGVV